MRASPEHAVRVGCVIGLCCFLSSCAHGPHSKITPKEIPALTEEVAERIPLRAGFFMDERFKEVRYRGRGAVQYQKYDQEGIKRNIDFDVRTAFEQAARRMFREVVPITGMETSKDWRARNLDVVVFVGAAICESEFGHLIYTTLSAEWSVMSPDGKVIMSVRPVGEGQTQPGGRAKEGLVEAVDAYIRKLYDSLVMSTWWRDSSWKSN